MYRQHFSLKMQIEMSQSQLKCQEIPRTFSALHKSQYYIIATFSVM